MPEINHQDSDSPPPIPARPLTGDKVLELELKQRRRFAGRGERIKTDCKGIDEYVLGGDGDTAGGLERGIVVGISADVGVEARLISLHFLASVLLSQSPADSRSADPRPVASIIDTTGSFPIDLLAKVLSSRVGPGKNGSEVTRLMEMVTISRVFDIEGLWEVLGELSVADDVSAHPPPPVQRKIEKQDAQTEVEIGDSESESEDSDEILEPVDAGEGVEAGIEIIIVDNLTHILSTVLTQKEKTTAHTLISTLATHIHNLSRSKNILTILHNTTVPLQQPSKDQSQPRPQAQTAQSPSVFTSPLSTGKRPALGKIFSQFPNLHILLSSHPKTRRDAEILYGDPAGSGEATEYVSVLEVLRDETPALDEKKRKRRREQRWTAFEIRDGVTLVDAVFKREARRLDVEVRDVGAVAKIYGFGGRRV